MKSVSRKLAKALMLTTIVIAAILVSLRLLSL